MADDRLIITDDDLGLTPSTPAQPAAPAPPAMPRVAPPEPAVEITFGDRPPAATAAGSLATPTFGSATDPAVPSGELAPIGGRVGAALIDSAIFVGALIVVGVLQAAGLPKVAGSLLLLGALAAIFAAPMGRTGVQNGQTFGMQATGVRKVRDDGQPFSPLSAQAWYWLSGLALGLIVIGALANIIAPLLHSQRKSLRDLLMRTTSRQA